MCGVFGGTPNAFGEVAAFVKQSSTPNPLALSLSKGCPSL